MLKKQIIKFVPAFLLISVFLFACPPSVFAQLSINLVAVNASDQEKSVKVKHYLPKELDPEDVLETGVLKIDYDVNKGAYYVHGDISFQAKESKTFKIRVRDVWQIAPEEIEILKSQLDENLKLMEGNENYGAITTAKDHMVVQLDYILAQQVNYSENIGRRIEEYRAYVGQLEDIRGKAYSLESLEGEGKHAESIQADKTIKLLIEVKNPSDTKEKEVTQKHYLPKEIRSEHVVDNQGFDVRFDDEKQKAYLSKEETFKAAEVKKYTIVIKDIWQLPLSKVDALEGRAEKAMDEILTSIYAPSGEFIFNKIQEKLQQIRDSQQEGLSVKKHIGTFRINTKRYDDAEQNVLRLEQMLNIVRAKKLEELEKGKVKNVLQKLQALKGLAALSEAIFKKGISVTQTWRIIFGTIIFIALFTTWHFITWRSRSKNMGEENAPPPGEEMKVVPKPGEGDNEEEEDEE